MNERNALERQLAGVVRGAMRPPRAVDAAAIVRSATAAGSAGHWSDITTRLRRSVTPASSMEGFSMSSVLRFTVAAVILALFGGFLLTGILTTQHGDDVIPAAVTESPPPTAALLLGMVTEETEPGVLRVVNDGVRDLPSGEASGIVAGYDGSMWLLREDEFFRLGSEASHAWPEESLPVDGRIFEIAPDGTMWIFAQLYPLIPGTRSGTALRSADGETWTPLPCPAPCSVCPETCAGVTVAPDGEVWASWPDEGATRWRVGHLGPAGWEPLEGYISDELSPQGFSQLFSGGTGDLYGVGEGWGRTLYRYEDGAWSRVHDLPVDAIIDVGRDGTVWQLGTAFQQGGLARFAGGEWTAWTPAELPDVELPLRPDDDEFAVAPDGSLWVSPSCDGLVRFDGDTIDRYLSGRCISMDIAGDGSVWALADTPDGQDLYVITPEAVGARP